jgi:hypothetical protein
VNLFTDTRFKHLVQSHRHRFMSALVVPIKDKKTGTAIAVLMAINKMSLDRIALGTQFSAYDEHVAVMTSQLIADKMCDDEEDMEAAPAADIEEPPHQAADEADNASSGLWSMPETDSRTKAMVSSTTHPVVV